MQKHMLGIIIFMLMTISASAVATPTPTTVGVGAGTGTVNCAKLSNGVCNWQSTNPSGYDSQGSSTHTALSGASTITDIRGTASASGEANLNSYLPVLHAYASSYDRSTTDFSPLAGGIYRNGTPPIVYTGEGSSSADANVWAVQGYEYTGLTPFDLTITATLDSVFSTSGAGGNLGHAGFSLSIFDAAGYVFDPNDTSLSYSESNCPIFNSPTRFCSGGPAIYAYGSKNLTETGTTSLTLTHTLNTGDKFFVSAFMDANACCSLTVDSSHTLNLAFNDFTQLSSIAVPGVAVPEPGSVPLALLGLVLLAAGTRGHRWGAGATSEKRRKLCLSIRRNLIA